jgi:hypothetical protein
LTQYVTVRLRRPWGDAEPQTDLLVRAATRDQLDDLELPLRQDEWRVVGSAHGNDATPEAAGRPSADGSIRGPTLPGLKIA